MKRMDFAQDSDCLIGTDPYYGLPGQIDVVQWYADSEIYIREVTFSVPEGEWNEFQESQFFRDLMEYLESCRQRHSEIQRKSSDYCAMECTGGICPSDDSPNSQECRKSVFEAIRSVFRRRKYW